MGEGRAGGGGAVSQAVAVELKMIPVVDIVPSPYQQRKHFSPTALAELAKSIQRDGLIQPVTVRSVNSHYELIAGERRWRAIRSLGEDQAVLARVVEASDNQARRMCAAENLQREDLSPIETVEAIVEMVDAELIEDDEYRGMGQQPVHRVRWLLGRMAADQSNGTEHVINKFINNVVRIFDNLPKPVDWRSFYNNDLPLITSLDEDVKQLAIEQKLNKSQAKALNNLKKDAPSKYQEIVSRQGVNATTDLLDYRAQEPTVPLREVSAREIDSIRTRETMYQAGLFQHADVTTPPLPSGKYRCIVIDPPWPVQKIEREERPHQGQVLEYPTMSLEDIEALPVGNFAFEDGCHLYLWVTQKYLPDGLRMMEAWGFRYQCVLTWVKPTGMTPYSWMYNTEHVLFGRAGNLPLDRLGLKLSFEAPVTVHSAKPDVFYTRVIQATPGPRLEMFARREREGFDVWGNEV